MGAFSLDTILLASWIFSVDFFLCLLDFLLPIASSEVTGQLEVEVLGQRVTEDFKGDLPNMVFSTNENSEILYKAPFGLYIVALVALFAAAGLSWFFSEAKGVPKSNMWFVIPPACLGALFWVIATICVWASDDLAAKEFAQQAKEKAQEAAASGMQILSRSVGNFVNDNVNVNVSVDSRTNFMTFFQAFLSWVGAALCGWATARVVIRDAAEFEGESGHEGANEGAIGAEGSSSESP
jgi:hypothetical protein